MVPLAVHPESGFRRLVEVVPIGTVVLDATEMLIVNAALLDLLHYPSFKDLEGQDISSLLHKTDVARLQSLSQGEREASGTLLLASQVHAREHGGGWRRLELQVVPLTFDGRECTALIFRDLRSDERRRLLASVFEARDTERRRLARDLHDESGQGLTSLIAGLAALESKVGPEAAKVVAEQRDIAENTLDDLRALTHDLYPAALDRFGLKAALQRLAGPGVEVDLDGLDGVKLSNARRLAFYRIAQEALTNAWRHAEPATVTISARSRPLGLVLKISDNGCGFEVPRASAGLGLINMRERAESVGADFRLTSQPEHGTTIEVEVSLP